MDGSMFISLDGIDGAGKSTQIDLLCDVLSHAGHRVSRFRDPGTTALGESIREILLHREDIPLAMTSEMLLYMAARSQLVSEQIRPALAEGHVVVCDRFLLANIVYQGVAGGLNVEELWSVGNCATGGLRPDKTIVLDIDPQLAFQRIQRGHDRLEKRGLEYFQRVREGFLSQANRASSEWLIVDASLPVQDIHRQIASFVLPG